MKTILEQITYLSPADLLNFKPESGKIYSGLPNELYHSFVESECSTSIKYLIITIQHWIDREFKHTDALAFGSLFHDSMESLRTGKDLTEYSRTIDDYGRRDKKDIANFILKYYPLIYNEEYHEDIREMTTKKVSRDSLQEIAEELEEIYLDGRRKVTTESFERSNAMVKAIKEHPVTSKLIEHHGIPELSVFSTIDVEIDGIMIPVPVRIRPDDVIEFESEVWINDWKSLRVEATDKNIQKACWNWRYDIQAAMYHDVLSRFTDKEIKFRLIFAEANKPAKEKVRVVQLPDWDMEAGWYDYRKGLENKARWLYDNTVWKGFDIPEDGIDIIAMRKTEY